MNIGAILSWKRLLIVAVLAVSQPTWGAELQLDPVSVKKNSLAVVVDPRMELLSIVQYLSDYRTAHPTLVAQSQFQYRTEVDEWFSRSKDHPVMEMFSRMASKGFGFDAPPNFVLYLNQDLSLDPALATDGRLELDRMGGKDQMARFVAAFKSFAVDSGFPEFYQKHLPYYKQIAEETMKTVGGGDNVGEVEKYYGDKRNSYSVVIASLFGHGSFGPQIERKRGVKDIYCVMGPTGVRDGTPVFGSTDIFNYLQRHEFSHSFVNPLTAKHWDLVGKYSNLLAPMAEKMRASAYGEWHTVVNESIIRAVTSRLAYRIDGREAGDKELNENKSRGFVFTDALVGKLEEYEQNRSKYPTFDSYYPELVKAFEGFSPDSVRALLPKEGMTINRQSQVGKCIVYDVAEGEGTADAVSYITKMHDRFWSSRELVDAAKLDEPARKEKLKDGFVIYTTIGSPVFNAATAPLGIKIDKGTFEWKGVKAPVGELRVFLIGKNPYGRGYCTVYAGGSTRLLSGMNSLFHGPCSYHIFQGIKLLKEGHYDGEFVSIER